MVAGLAPAAVQGPSGSPVADARAIGRGYLHSRAFDATLILAPLATALAVAGIVAGRPELFPVVLFADLWLLGYHHVVATYTRLGFGRSSLRRNRLLAVDALLLVIAATLGLAYTVGPWAIATAFLYLQWFHYMRQSYGLARMFFRATPAGRPPEARDRAADLVIYLVAVYGIATRSATLGDQFLNLPVRPLVLPATVIEALGIAAVAAVLGWTARAVRSFARGPVDLHYAGYVASHVVTFVAAYVVIDDANTGWLAINVWHNLQYVLVVWMANGRRYAAGVDPEERLLSSLSQPGRAVAYFATCLAISTVLYLSLDRLNVLVLGGGLAVTTGLYMGINFHHYVVDALIWKRPRLAAPSSAA